MIHVESCVLLPHQLSQFYLSLTLGVHLFVRDLLGRSHGQLPWRANGSRRAESEVWQKPSMDAQRSPEINLKPQKERARTEETGTALAKRNRGIT